MGCDQASSQKQGRIKRKKRFIPTPDPISIGRRLLNQDEIERLQTFQSASEAMQECLKCK